MVILLYRTCVGCMAPSKHGKGGKVTREKRRKRKKRKGKETEKKLVLFLEELKLDVVV